MRRSWRPTFPSRSSKNSASGFAASEGQRQDDVLLRRQHRQQVEELEDEADVLSAQLRDLGVAELAEPCSRDRDVALSRLVERREEVHQRRFSGARGAHDRGQLPALDSERDAAQRVHGRLALAVDTAQFVRLDHGAVSGGRVSPAAISRHREVGHRGQATQRRASGPRPSTSATPWQPLRFSGGSCRMGGARLERATSCL